MLGLLITKSTDYDSLGSYEFEATSIDIGCSRNSTLRIFDRILSTPVHIRIVEKEKAIIIHNASSGFYLNEKKHQVSSIIKKGDIIKCGDTEFKITKIQPNENAPLDIKAHRDELIGRIKSKNPELLKVLNAIEDDLVNMGG